MAESGQDGAVEGDYDRRLRGQLPPRRALLHLLGGARLEEEGRGLPPPFSRVQSIEESVEPRRSADLQFDAAKGRQANHRDERRIVTSRRTPHRTDYLLLTASGPPAAAELVQAAVIWYGIRAAATANTTNVTPRP